VTIGAREIYDELVGMRDDVRAVTQHSEAVRATLTDHEERIRGVERWKYAIPVTVLMGASALGVEVIRIVSK
jgi:hypothetical protein